MKWTNKLPDKTGWFWLRHIAGSIPDYTPTHCIIMRRAVKKRGKWCYKYDKQPSVYWLGRWRKITAVPTGWNWRWSDKPIRLPRGETNCKPTKH